MLNRLQKSYMIVPPQQFLEDFRRGKGNQTELCICFDCGLKSQYDIAYPVLDALGMKAFWFLYTSVFENGVVSVEQYHHFRFSCFETIDRFYSAFFQVASVELGERFEKGCRDFQKYGYLNWAPFYTEEDRLYKFLRDRVMTGEEFDGILHVMMEEAGYNVEDYRQVLWLNRDEVRHLAETGHIIGMHTHTHPNEIGRLSYEEQLWEYGTCQNILQEITGQNITTMSHPCNSYNSNTLRVLEKLGVEAGFRADRDPRFHSKYEIPRIDHAAWIREQKEILLWE